MPQAWVHQKPGRKFLSPVFGAQILNLKIPMHRPITLGSLGVKPMQGEDFFFPSVELKTQASHMLKCSAAELQAQDCF